MNTQIHSVQESKPIAYGENGSVISVVYQEKLPNISSNEPSFVKPTLKIESEIFSFFQFCQFTSNESFHNWADRHVEKLSNQFHFLQATFYSNSKPLAQDTVLYLYSTYAIAHNKVPHLFKYREGLVGQSWASKKSFFIPTNEQTKALSYQGIVEISAKMLVVVPLMHQETVSGVLEFTTSKELSTIDKFYLQAFLEIMSVALFQQQAKHI